MTGMNRKKLITNVNTAISETLAHRISDRDFQRQRVYDFHIDMKEDQIIPAICHDIVKRLDKLWNIHTTELYPEKWTENVAEGWPLAKRYAAIQIPYSMMTVSYVIHEHAHGVVECFLNYDDTDIKDPGHGPLWCGVFTLGMSYIMGTSYDTVYNSLVSRGIHVIDEDATLAFLKLFSRKT